MIEPFYFGHPQRALLGLQHAAASKPNSAVLVCAPLLQDGTRSHRALWALSEALAGAGSDVLRFDWYGSGDSAGGSDEIDLPGLVGDLTSALAMLRASTRATRVRLFGLRNAALPLLAYASACRETLDLVLWEPTLDGRALVDSWHALHRQQLHGVGRFHHVADVASEPDELFGCTIHPDLLDALAALDGRKLALPSGSRLLLAHWQATPLTEEFVRAQREAGVIVDVLHHEGVDQPDWDHPNKFEIQVFPRRAVVQLAKRLAEAA